MQYCALYHKISDYEMFSIAKDGLATGRKSGNDTESGIESDSMCEFFSNRRRLYLSHVCFQSISKNEIFELM